MESVERRMVEMKSDKVKNKNVTLQVLVAEDEPSIRTLIARTLGLDSLRVETAENGEAALKAIKKGGFGLLLLDYRLPDMNAREVIERLEKFPRDKQIPVVLVTGRISYFSNPIDTKLIVDVLRKPFDITSLRRVVSKNLIAA